MSGAAVAAALSLALGSVAAQDDEGSMEEMASMATDGRDGARGSTSSMPWARESPMLDLAGASYMVIHNNTDADDALIGASSPAAEVVELHLSVDGRRGHDVHEPGDGDPHPGRTATRS